MLFEKARFFSSFLSELSLAESRHRERCPHGGSLVHYPGRLDPPRHLDGDGQLHQGQVEGGDSTGDGPVSCRSRDSGMYSYSTQKKLSKRLEYF